MSQGRRTCELRGRRSAAKKRVLSGCLRRTHCMAGVWPWYAMTSRPVVMALPSTSS